MKQIRMLPILLLILIALCEQSCDSEDDDDELGDWKKSAPLEGTARSGAVLFTLNEVAYLGLGRGNDDEYFLDFYAFDGSTEIWRQVKSFPGTGRERAVAFSVNGKGYVSLGYNRDLNVEELSDVWEYDPQVDEWRQLSDFPGGRRYSAVTFDFDTKAYVGGGFDGDNVRGDFYEYDAIADNWTKIATNPGDKKEEASSFVINDKAYYFGGRSNGSYSTDFWEFDPATNQWTDITPDDDEDYYDDFTAAVRRHDAVAFSFNGYGYVALGTSGSNLSSVYEYIQGSGEWIQKTSFEGSARSLSVVFVVSDKVYVGTGIAGSRHLDDFWTFNPLEEYDEDD